MSLLISINGVDFEPYRSVERTNPLVGKTKESQKVQSIQRDLDHPEEFKDVLAKTTQKKFKLYEEIKQEKEKVSRKAIHAKDLMSAPVITLNEKDKALNVHDVLEKNYIRHIPIVNLEEQIIGIVSDRNLMNRAEGDLISDFMSKSVIVAQPMTLLPEIAKVMVDHKISSVPIVDEDRHVIGIITSSDLIESVFKNPNIDLWA